MALMAGGDPAAVAAREAMAAASGTDLAGFEAQLASTEMFYAPADAVEFVLSPALIATMDSVRKFSDTHGLIGADLDYVGIEFPGGETLGDPANIKLRFDESFMQMAAEGGL